jgi:hypothetical protein
LILVQSSSEALLSCEAEKDITPSHTLNDVSHIALASSGEYFIETKNHALFSQNSTTLENAHSTSNFNF